jgi:hypothetical protein
MNFTRYLVRFVLGKMAPILSKRFDKADKIEVSGTGVGPQIAVINYHQADKPVFDPSLVHQEHPNDRLETTSEGHILSPTEKTVICQHNDTDED